MLHMKTEKSPAAICSCKVHRSQTKTNAAQPSDVGGSLDMYLSIRTLMLNDVIGNAVFL